MNGTGSDLRNLPNCFELPLADTLSMCAYDHRGLGQSTPTEPSHQQTMAEMAADAVAIVDALDWDRFRVVGVSFGGMVAQEIALLAGSRVERLALVCTSAGGAGGSSFPLHEVYTLPRAESIDVRVRISDLRTATDPRRAAALRTFMLAAPSSYPPTDGLLRQLEARRLHNTWERLPFLRVPTFVAAGRHDGIAPLANSEALARQIPRARLGVFNGGHGFLWEDPTAWPMIHTFLTAPGY